MLCGSPRSDGAPSPASFRVSNFVDTSGKRISDRSVRIPYCCRFLRCYSTLSRTNGKLASELRAIRRELNDILLNEREAAITSDQRFAEGD